MCSSNPKLHTEKRITPIVATQTYGILWEYASGEWAFTGGHPKHGESSLEGVKTEIKEELGIVAENPILFKSVKGKNVFCDLYYVKQDIDLNDVVQQDEEVSEVMLATKEEIDSLLSESKIKKGHYMMFKDYLEYKNENM